MKRLTSELCIDWVAVCSYFLAAAAWMVHRPDNLVSRVQDLCQVLHMHHPCYIIVLDSQLSCIDCSIGFFGT